MRQLVQHLNLFTFVCLSTSFHLQFITPISMCQRDDWQYASTKRRKHAEKKSFSKKKKTLEKDKPSVRVASESSIGVHRTQSKANKFGWYATNDHFSFWSIVEFIVINTHIYLFMCILPALLSLVHRRFFVARLCLSATCISVSRSCVNNSTHTRTIKERNARWLFRFCRPVDGHQKFMNTLNDIFFLSFVFSDEFTVSSIWRERQTANNFCQSLEKKIVKS